LILLARHAETDDNVVGRVQGRRDSALNARGRAQARALGAALAGEGLAALYASDLRRALETAEIVGAVLGLEPRVDERLAESRRGAWEGRLLSELRGEEPKLWAAWRRAGASFRFPDAPDGRGESLGEHMARVVAALDEIALGPLPALAVCHGGTIRCAVAHAWGRDLDAYHELEVANAAVIRLPLPRERGGEVSGRARQGRRPDR
jgi:2,3-bisphosphoglycerate-dependent phosphoglycerate mutase